MEEQTSDQAKFMEASKKIKEFTEIVLDKDVASRKRRHDEDVGDGEGATRRGTVSSGSGQTAQDREEAKLKREGDQCEGDDEQVLRAGHDEDEAFKWMLVLSKRCSCTISR